MAAFFESVKGNIDASYLGYPTLAMAASQADLVVVAKLQAVAAGPTLAAPELASQGGTGIDTMLVTAKVERVVDGDAPGKKIDFIVISDGADAALGVPITAVSETDVMLLLYRRDDGRLEFAGPQGLLMESGGGVTAPLVGDDDYDKDARKNKTLAEAVETVTPTE